MRCLSVFVFDDIDILRLASNLHTFGPYLIVGHVLSFPSIFTTLCCLFSHPIHFPLAFSRSLLPIWFHLYMPYFPR